MVVILPEAGAGNEAKMEGDPVCARGSHVREGEVARVAQTMHFMKHFAVSRL